MATNPLLLTLLCLIFEESTDFPSNRYHLYEEGVNILLKKWDGQRNIQREKVYKKLSYERKEDLLSMIALTTFESGNYFFKEELAKRYIRDYIQNLPDAQTDPEALLLDSEAVLKSIEAQHGLFVERARGIYSFSHLTFHEFFTARNIILSRNPQQAFQQLVSHITDNRWREVFLLTVEKLNNADDLLLLMKQQIDKLLETDEELQEFLTWVDLKSISVKASYKSSAIRAFYFTFNLDLTLDLALALDSTFVRTFNLDLTLDLALALALDPNRDLALVLILGFDLDHADSHILTLTRDLARDLARNRNRDRDLEGIETFNPDLDPDLDPDLAPDLERIRTRDPDLARDLARERAFELESKRKIDNIRARARASIPANRLSRVSKREIDNSHTDNSHTDTRTCIRALEIADYLALDTNLQPQIQELKQELEDLEREDLQKWWQTNGQAWTELLRNMMIQHRNIGHDWQLNDNQRKLLQQYYYANKLLVDCLNSECYVSRSVRQQIENTLLLPANRIQGLLKFSSKTLDTSTFESLMTGFGYSKSGSAPAKGNRLKVWWVHNEYPRVESIYSPDKQLVIKAYHV